jgi:nitrate reductase delta subunit
MDERRLLFKILSELMQYPDEEWIKRLAEIKVVGAELPETLRQKIEAFITEIDSASLLRLQEKYTAAFYLDAKTTLNMSYHSWGDSEKRAQALAQLERVYRDGGYERLDGELPDFLPLMLEFLSIHPEALGMELFRQCLAGADALQSRLTVTAPGYAGLLDSLACLLSKEQGGDRESCL